MITELSQQTIAEYASDALTTQKPEGTDYSQGVRVGRTIPAKWWNWLFNAVTKRLIQSNADAQDMLAEMQNTVTDAGLTLDDTDNTQLSQAVDIKADAKIDEFVDAKRKTFLRIWNGNNFLTMFNIFVSSNVYPRTFAVLRNYVYPSGYNLASSTFIVNVNGIYFAYLTSAAQLVYTGVLFSADLYNWFPIGEIKRRAHTNIYNDEYIYIGAVFYNREWYLITETKYRESGNEYITYTVEVKKSVDLTNWTTVYTSTRQYVSGFDSSVPVAIFIAGSLLYFIDSDGTLYKTTDGTTCTATSAVSVSLTPLGYWVVPDVVPISDSRYIIGGYLFDSALDSMTAIPLNNTYHNCICYKLNNDKGIAGYTYGEYRLSFITTWTGGNIFLVQADGTVVQLKYVAESNPYYYCLMPGVDGILIRGNLLPRPDGMQGYVLTWNEYSYDGNSFSLMAFDGTDYLFPVCKMGSNIICVTDSHKIYSVENNLSPNIADYKLVNDNLPSFVTDVIGSEYYCTLIYSSYDNALIVPGAFSVDGGVTWTQSTVHTVRHTYGFAGPAQGKDRNGRLISFCGEESTDISITNLRVVETKPCINTVSGQTLYLQ